VFFYALFATSLIIRERKRTLLTAKKKKKFAFSSYFHLYIYFLFSYYLLNYLNKVINKNASGLQYCLVLHPISGSYIKANSNSDHKRSFCYFSLIIIIIIVFNNNNNEKQRNIIKVCRYKKKLPVSNL
jgi:predicted MPP superfamily phosphohydrolase